MYQVYAAKQASAVVFNGEHITQNCPFPWEGSGPPRNTCMVTGPAPLHKENAMSIDPALFPPKTVHVPLVLYDGTDPYPPQNCPFPWGDLDPSTICLLRPNPPHMPNGISIRPPVIAGYLSVVHTDTYTDRPRHKSVAICRIYSVSRKMAPLYCCPQLRQMLTDFQHFFTSGLICKVVIKQ